MLLETTTNTRTIPKMKNTTGALGLLAVASAASAATETHLTGAEWAVPTANNDPYQCVMSDIPRYLTAAPPPSGALSSALLSYEKGLYASCTPPTTLPYQPCPVPSRTALCAFSTAVPTSLLPVYSSYASSAAAWWSAGNGDVVAAFVKDCPYLWYDSLLMLPGSGANMNRTVAHAQCWAEAHPTGAAGGTATLSGGGGREHQGYGDGNKGDGDAGADDDERGGEGEGGWVDGGGVGDGGRGGAVVVRGGLWEGGR